MDHADISRCWGFWKLCLAVSCLHIHAHSTWVTSGKGRLLTFLWGWTDETHWSIPFCPCINLAWILLGNVYTCFPWKLVTVHLIWGGLIPKSSQSPVFLQYAVFACRKGSELELWTTDDLGCFFLFVPINSFWSVAVYGVFTFVGNLWSSVYTRVKIQTMSWRCGSDEVYATGGSTTCSTILMWNMFCSKIGQELKDKNLWHPLN